MNKLFQIAVALLAILFLVWLIGTTPVISRATQSYSLCTNELSFGSPSPLNESIEVYYQMNNIQVFAVRITEGWDTNLREYADNQIHSAYSGFDLNTCDGTTQLPTREDLQSRTKYVTVTRVKYH